ncbi:MAG: flagellar basal body-associated FliL family protein [Arcobacteraceae bacterium]|jgi:flagellar FliL protein|nr:flagellar basal body-associated FliL family protein [Arcobacteraceae bacterium]
MAEEKQEEVAAKKSGNPMMIILVVLIVILMAAIGGIGYILYSKGFFDDQAAGEKKTEEAPAKDEKNPENVFFNSEIKDLVLNVTTSKGREKLMKLSFSMKSTEPTIDALVTANKPEIVDIVIHQVSSRNSEELLTAAGKDLLKEELVSEVNSILNEAVAENPDIKEKNMIKDIYFTTFVIK